MDELDQEILDKYAAQVEQAKNGEINVFDVATRLNELKKALKGLYGELKDEILEERSKYPDKEQIINNGYEITIMSRKNYKYDHDEGYNRINKKLKQRKNQMRQALTKNIEIIDNRTGEIIEPADFTESTYPVLKFIGEEVI